MFVAIREIRAAKGRFGLMAGVVALITFLLVVLTALTNGLGHRSTSAIEALPAEHVVLAPASGTVAYGDSQLSDQQLATWKKVQQHATVLGIGHVRIEDGSNAASTAVFTTDIADNRIVLPHEAAETLQAKAGDTVDVQGTALVVDRIEDDQWYSHSPVARVSAATFEKLTHQPARTALLLDAGVPDEQREALDREAGTESMTPDDSLVALPGYSSERGSLLMIQGFLYGISALVVLAFVSVWTVQRTREVAVMRALGGSRGYVLRDALGQALILLLVGVGLGSLLAALGVLGIGGNAPVLATAMTYALPVLGILGLGLLGSLLATRRVAGVDPLIALGGN